MKYREAISDAIVGAMEDDPKVALLGENVTVPHGVFGTVSEAFQRFPERVLETPVSETMLTGACVGLAMEGYKPILVHCRADFSLLSFEHLINTAAKIPFLHRKPLPFVMRVVVGHGWGQGPVHSQSFHNMLAEVPGLHVRVPARPSHYEQHLRTALADSHATIIYEPRRLFEVDDENLRQAPILRPDITIATIGDTILDALQAATALEGLGVAARCVPWERLDSEPRRWIEGPLLVVDMAPRRSQRGLVAPAFVPQGVSQVFERLWYPTPEDIVAAACELLGLAVPETKEADELYAPLGSAF